MRNQHNGYGLDRKTAVELGILDSELVALEDEIDALMQQDDLSVDRKIQLISVYLNRPKAQTKAIETLAELGEKAVDVLVSTLHDSEIHEWSKSSILEALGKIGGRQAADTLLEELSRVYVPNSSLIRALGMLGDERAIPSLVNALKYREVGSLDLTLYKALPLFGNKIVEPLIQALQHENPDIRGGAIRILGIMRREEAFDFIAQALEDIDTNVQFEAVFALQKFGKRSWSHLRQIRQNNPQLLDKVFHYGNWAEIDAYRNNEALKEQAPISEAKTKYLAQAESCPLCEKAAEDLTWVCLQEKPKMWHILTRPPFRCITVCDDCHFQVQLLGFLEEKSY